MLKYLRFLKYVVFTNVIPSRNLLISVTPFRTLQFIEIHQLVEVPVMSQKSILSFFKSPAGNGDENEKPPNRRTEQKETESTPKQGTEESKKEVEEKEDVKDNLNSNSVTQQPQVNGISQSVLQNGTAPQIIYVTKRKTARKQIINRPRPVETPKNLPIRYIGCKAPNDNVSATNGIEESISTDGHNKKKKKLDDSLSSSDSTNSGETPVPKKQKKNVITDDNPAKQKKTDSKSDNTVPERKNTKVSKNSECSTSINRNDSSKKTANKRKISKKTKIEPESNESDAAPKRKNTKGNENVECNTSSNGNDSLKQTRKRHNRAKKAKIESESSESEDVQNKSPDEEIPSVTKKRRKNIISDNDDSPVKSKKPNKQSNYVAVLDQFMLKKKDDTKNEAKDDESVNISDSPSKTSPIKAKEKSEEKSEKEKPSGSLNSYFAPQTKKKEPKDSGSTSDKESPEVSDKKSTAVKEEVYDPSLSNYHPIDNACWRHGETVPYLALARTLEEIESVSGRLKMIEILANFLRSVIILSPDDLLYCVYLCLNRLAPEYEGIELGVGEMLLMKALAQATGRTVGQIKSAVSVKGDLGAIAESSRGSQRVMFAFPKLTVSSVFTKFKEIAQMSGNAAMSKKTDKIQALLVACRNCEAKYIIRSLSGKLRIGLAEQSVLAALAQAAVLTPPNQSYPPEVINSSSKTHGDTFKKKLEAQTLILKTTYCECPNYDMIIPVLLKEGISGLEEHCRIHPGMPVKPMLAHPTKGIDEVLRRFDTNEFTCEFKYDGERAQIHVMEDGKVKIYSRNQEDNTSKYPEVISRLSSALQPSVKSCILDSEAVAWDRETKQILPFQMLSTRKKKDAVDSEITVQVCITAFDLLYLNGESLVKKPLRERRDLLKQHFKEVSDEFAFAKSMDGNSADTMQEFLEESIKGKCEGLMVKSLDADATYEIAKRSHNWLKLKKDYLEGVGDTLDLVVIGGWNGKGKRTGSYGGFLLACYDDETEEFQTICKIGTGFKDEDLETHAKFFKEHSITAAKSYYRYDSALNPDVWFEPVQVWEVKCADLSISPVHKAALGIVDPEKGISLRFPRFLKVRDDKKPEDATTAAQVARMYSSQEQIQNQGANNSKLDEDFY